MPATQAVRPARRCTRAHPHRRDRSRRDRVAARAGIRHRHRRAAADREPRGFVRHRRRWRRCAEHAHAACLFEWARGRRLGEVLDIRIDRSMRARCSLGCTNTAPPSTAVARSRSSWAHTVTAFRLARSHSKQSTRPTARCSRRRSTARRLPIDALWADPPHPPHLLHGDFHPNNILVWRGRLTPIDFQDALWGFEMQDIAITVTALGFRADPTALVAALPARLRDRAALARRRAATVARAQRCARPQPAQPRLQPAPTRDSTQFVARHADWFATDVHR